MRDTPSCLFSALCLWLALCGLWAGPAYAESKLVTSDSYIMGAGGWTCAEVLEARTTENASLTGQAAGWVLGAWSHATTMRGRAFTDLVEHTGGTKIYQATLQQCSTADPKTQLYRVVYSMIDNSDPDTK